MAISRYFSGYLKHKPGIKLFVLRPVTVDGVEQILIIDTQAHTSIFATLREWEGAIAKAILETDAIEIMTNNVAVAVPQVVSSVLTVCNKC